MPDLNPAVETDPFPDWPFGMDRGDPRRALIQGQYLDVPTDLQKCPYCEAQLKVKVVEVLGDEWALRLRCTDHDPLSDDGVDHSRLPYNNWMPAAHTVEKWLRRNYQVVASEHAVTDYDLRTHNWRCNE